MSTLSECHKKLTNGVGKCSVPMWGGGMPAGFCDDEAYSRQTEEDRQWRDGTNRYIYVPALACPAHGGHKKKKALNLCDYCKKYIAECGSNPKFGTGFGNDNVYECDIFEPTPKQSN